MRRWACVVTVMSLGLVGSSARADGPGDARLAQALFDEGRALMEQKRYAEACPKLKESQRLDPGGGTLLNLASCHTAEGKTATALDEFHEALAFAVKDNRYDREKIARANIDKLEREVPRVTVLVPRPVEGVEVKLDTTPLAPAAWGVATPVDPGPHTIVATAPRHQTVRVTFSSRVGERKVIELPENKSDEVAMREAPPPTTYVDRPTRANPVFYAALFTGLGALTVSSVTGVLTITNTIEAGESCTEKRTYCKDQAGRDAVSKAQTFGWISTVTLGVGVVGLVVSMLVPSKKAITVGANGLGMSF